MTTKRVYGYPQLLVIVLSHRLCSVNPGAAVARASHGPRTSTV